MGNEMVALEARIAQMRNEGRRKSFCRCAQERGSCSILDLIAGSYGLSDFFFLSFLFVPKIILVSFTLHCAFNILVSHFSSLFFQVSLWFGNRLLGRGLDWAVWEESGKSGISGEKRVH